MTDSNLDPVRSEAGFLVLGSNVLCPANADHRTYVAAKAHAVQHNLMLQLLDIDEGQHVRKTWQDRVRDSLNEEFGGAL